MTWMSCSGSQVMLHPKPKRTGLIWRFSWTRFIQVASSFLNVRWVVEGFQVDTIYRCSWRSVKAEHLDEMSSRTSTSPVSLGLSLDTPSETKHGTSATSRRLHWRRSVSSYLTSKSRACEQICSIRLFFRYLTFSVKRNKKERRTRTHHHPNMAYHDSTRDVLPPRYSRKAPRQTLS